MQKKTYGTNRCSPNHRWNISAKQIDGILGVYAEKTCLFSLLLPFFLCPFFYVFLSLVPGSGVCVCVVRWPMSLPRFAFSLFVFLFFLCFFFYVFPSLVPGSGVCVCVVRWPMSLPRFAFSLFVFLFFLCLFFYVFPSLVWGPFFLCLFFSVSPSLVPGRDVCGEVAHVPSWLETTKTIINTCFWPKRAKRSEKKKNVLQSLVPSPAMPLFISNNMYNMQCYI